jgi:8-oxo-dGTP pyrophosphatase MutT (NUDIX family)
VVAIVPTVPTLEDIEKSLDRYQPSLVGGEDLARAAVAMILRERDARPEVLFIERARRKGDPWSGHMAFPGGRMEPSDAGTRHAAERETLEEVGLSLADATHLGRLDDLQGYSQRSRGMVVSAHVYWLPEPGRIVTNREVQQAFWFPVASLLDSERHVTYPHATYEGRQLPGILVGEPDRHIVWGLTYRFLDLFFSIVGRPLPDKWTDAR